VPYVFLQVEVADTDDPSRTKEVLKEDLMEEDDVISVEVLGYDAKILAVSSGDDQRFYGPFPNDDEANQVADQQPEGAIVVALHSPDALDL
jgi:hypothetical protein